MILLPTTFYKNLKNPLTKGRFCQIMLEYPTPPGVFLGSPPQHGCELLMHSADLLFHESRLVVDLSDYHVFMFLQAGTIKEDAVIPHCNHDFFEKN